MFINTPSRQPFAGRDGMARFAEWWPAALIGLLALVGAAPDSSAQTMLRALL
ncbi:MAG: hypothetical protein K9G48_02945 [Reyranella sp.]|nr:hypothetical protein [Reyranella sp.]